MVSFVGCFGLNLVGGSCVGFGGSFGLVGSFVGFAYCGGFDGG